MPDWILALASFVVGFPAGVWLFVSVREWRYRRTPYPTAEPWDMPPQAFGIRPHGDS